MGNRQSKPDATTTQPDGSRTARFLREEGIDLSDGPLLTRHQLDARRAAATLNETYNAWQTAPLWINDERPTSQKDKRRSRLPWRKSSSQQMAPSSFVSVFPSSESIPGSGSTSFTTANSSRSIFRPTLLQVSSPPPPTSLKGRQLGNNDIPRGLRPGLSSPELSIPYSNRMRSNLLLSQSGSNYVEQRQKSPPTPPEYWFAGAHTETAKRPVSPSFVPQAINLRPSHSSPRLGSYALDIGMSQCTSQYCPLGQPIYTPPPAREPPSTNFSHPIRLHRKPIPAYNTPSYPLEPACCPEEDRRRFADNSKGLSNTSDREVDLILIQYPESSTNNFDITRSNASAQATLDRELAEQLQQEENEAMSGVPSLPAQSAFDPPKKPRFHLPVRKPSLGRPLQWEHPSVKRDEEYATQLQWEEVFAPGNSSPRKPLPEQSADMLLAQRLNEEERKRIREEMDKPKLRDCAVCGESVDIRELPALLDCKHEPHTCADCFKEWIASELKNKSWKEIKCPEVGCKQLMQHADVQRYATPSVYARFDNLSALEAINNDPNFRWCRSPTCPSGQIHEANEVGTTFVCMQCDFSYCILHEHTAHDGMSCREYDDRNTGKWERDRKDQENANIKALERFTKRCPGKTRKGECGWNIEKNDGCDHMTCTKCRYEFCWVCLADYARIRRRGNGAHRGDCPYHPDQLDAGGED